MARRPKRTLSEELQRHEECAISAMTLTNALGALYPDIPELGTAATCLRLAIQTFQRRRGEATTPAPESSQEQVA